MSVCYACFFKQIYLNIFLYDFHDFFFPPRVKSVALHQEKLNLWPQKNADVCQCRVEPKSNPVPVDLKCFHRNLALCWLLRRNMRHQPPICSWGNRNPAWPSRFISWCAAASIQWWGKLFLFFFCTLKKCKSELTFWRKFIFSNPPSVTICFIVLIRPCSTMIWVLHNGGLLQ